MDTFFETGELTLNNNFAVLLEIKNEELIAPAISYAGIISPK